MGLMLALLIGLQTAPGLVTKLLPAGNPQNWITDDDYPEGARRSGLQGTTEFRLAVDAGGKVESCTVTASSGWKVLDDRVCSLIAARARFSPAHDANGQAIPAYYINRFTWSVPGGHGRNAIGLSVEVSRVPESYARPAGLRLKLDADHRPVQCEVVQSSGSQAIDAIACPQALSMLAPGASAKPVPLHDGQPVLVTFYAAISH